MPSRTLTLIATLALTGFPNLALPAQETTTEKSAKKAKTPKAIAALKLRSIGPAITSGRISDIAIDPSDPNHWIIATSSGGVWQTHNAGTTFKPVFDSKGSYSIGCVTFDPSNPLNVWVGSGENNSQRSVSYGDGVYKSTDGGRSFKKVGLSESEHIARIVVDPRDSDRVFVASQGPLWRKGGDRGLYLTRDGGKSWQAVLQVDEHTGVNEVLMDPRDPDVLYVSTYQRRRHVYTLINGGPGGGVHKSTDGGKSWRKLGGGLPDGEVGRIGMALAPSDPDTVYAIFEAKGSKSGFYRSTDGGARWKKMSSYLSGSPQYYQEIYVDPKNPNRVYSMDTYMQVTEDGGATFKPVGEANKHVDNHSLWIDPSNTQNLLAGCDGGIYQSFDRGKTWRFFANLPITQFYRVAVDNDVPFYNVYGGTQDNFSMGGPSRTTSANGITNREWFMTRGGDGFETVVDPTDPDILYAESQYGGLVRYDRRTGETTDIKPRAGANDEPLRWNWNAPVIISPHLHTRLYFAANYLFRSDDRGNTWHKVGGNLTRQLNRNTFEVMDKVWNIDAIDKNRSTSVFGNIVSLCESPLHEGRLYVGTDDGLIQGTVDGGKTWQKRESFPGIPEMTYISALCASSHDKATVYATFDNHKRGDFKPYLQKSTDGGATWVSIAGDLPKRGSVHCLVEDHVKADLLFVGTEFGVFCTLDGGAQWHELSSGIPTIAVRDLEIQRRENDLVLATFGRGFYVLDDYSPLRGMEESKLTQNASLFPVKKAWLFVQRRPLGGRGKSFQGDGFFSLPNPAVGAVFTYHLSKSFKTRKQLRVAAEASASKKGKQSPYPKWDELRAEERDTAARVFLTIRDSADQVVRRIDGSKSPGLHRTTWDLRHAGIAGSGRRGGFGPLAIPGWYSVTVSTLIDGAVTEVAGPESFEIELLPGGKFPAMDSAGALAFQQDVIKLSRAVSAASTKLGSILTRLTALEAGVMNTPKADGKWLQQSHSMRQKALDMQVKMNGDRTISGRNEATLPGLSSRARAAFASFRSTSAPTNTHLESHRIATAQLAALTPQIRRLDDQLAALELKLEAAGGPPPAGKLAGSRGR